MHSTDSDAELIAAHTGMLHEAVDYLRRMPRHPMTSAMIAKIEAHLEAPRAVAAARIAEAQAATAIALQSRARGAGWFTADGRPELVAELVGNRLRISSPAAADCDVDAWQAYSTNLAAALAKGVDIDLHRLADGANVGTGADQ